MSRSDEKEDLAHKERRNLEKREIGEIIQGKFQRKIRKKRKKKKNS